MAVDRVPAKAAGCVQPCLLGLRQLFRRHKECERCGKPRTYELPAAGALGLLPAPEVTAAVLDFLAPSSIAALACASTWSQSLADDEEVWHKACLRAWANKQHSAQMRTWLSERWPPASKTSPSGPVRGASSSSSKSLAAAAEGWKARYVFALKDRLRCRILPEELCWDAARDASGMALPRRWHLTMHLGRWVDKEVVFIPGGGSLNDFDFRVLNFRVFQEIPWRPHGSDDRRSEAEEDEGGEAGEDTAEDQEEVLELEDQEEEDDEGEDEDGEQVEEEGHQSDSSQSLASMLGSSSLDSSSDENSRNDGSHLGDDTPGAGQRVAVPLPAPAPLREDVAPYSYSRSLGRGGRDRPLLRHTLAWGGRRAASEAAAAAAAAAGWVDGRRRDILPQPRFLRTLRPPPPPLLHFGRRFADGPFLMPLPLPLAAVPLPTLPAVPRRRQQGISGFSQIQVPSLPYVLRVGRTDDWGWSLTPEQEEGQEEPLRTGRHGIGSIGRVLRFESRQLRSAEHEFARQTPSATFTLYLRAAGEQCCPQGLQGRWECFDGFQGTMHAPTWVGSCIAFELLEPDDSAAALGELEPPENSSDEGQDTSRTARRQLSGICRMTFADSFQAMTLSFRASADASELKEGHLDLFVGQLGQGQPCFWQRGATQAAQSRSRSDAEVAFSELPPMVLVLTMGMFFGTASGPTLPPTGVPLGLPSLEEAALRAA